MKVKRLLGYSLIAGLLATALASVTAQDWRAERPTGLAPDPALTPEPIVQVYAARARGAKGTFGVHTWFAVKPSRAPAWTVYEVVGWRLRWSDSALAIRNRDPDASWFGSEAELLAERRGEGVDELIGRIDAAARTYPYAREYIVWPGPNSNTFTAWVARAVPELELDLPPTAIGKDYLGDRMFASAPSGSGFQFSLFGLLGITASAVEGFELNVLGLGFGLNPFSPAIRLPVIGRIGAPHLNGTAAAARSRSD